MSVNVPTKITLDLYIVDGGGLRGVIPTAMLKQLETYANEEYQKTPHYDGKREITISDLFDFIVGTSTGGLIALALTIAPVPPSFSQSFAYSFSGLGSALPVL